MNFTTGLSVPEGPLVLPDRSWLVVEMGEDRGCVTRISADGREKRIVAKTGRPNGLALDRDGFIWVAESRQPGLLRMTLDGAVEVWATECEGSPFLFPNDLCLGPDGEVYLTDSGIHIGDFAPGGRIRDDYQTVRPDGRVYKIGRTSHAVTLLDSGIRFTNGIAFGPDGNLYVNETLTGAVYRYGWRDGRVGPRKEFGNVIDPSAPPGYKGPDGMKFGRNGHLYVTVFGQQDVTVLGANGRVVKRVRTQGKQPSNVAFGPAKEKKIYVTEDELGTLEVLDVDTDGLPLYT
jgi:gluconolactonase